MEIRSHGGGCCGIRHLIGFPTTTQPGSKPPLPDKNSLNRLDILINGNLPEGRLCEVALTDNQVNVWQRALLERGFVMVTRFRNANSGNQVSVFHFMKKKGYSINKSQSPYWPVPPVNRGHKEINPPVKEPLTLRKTGAVTVKEVEWGSLTDPVDWTKPLFAYCPNNEVYHGQPVTLMRNYNGVYALISVSHTNGTVHTYYVTRKLGWLMNGSHNVYTLRVRNGVQKTVKKVPNPFSRLDNGAERY